MTRLLLLPFALLVGCMTYADDKHVLVASDCDYIEWHGGKKPSLKMWGVRNGDATRAVGSVAGTTLAGMAGLKVGTILPH